MGLQRILYRERAIVMKKFDPNVYLRTIQDYKINSLPIVPSIANFLIKSPLVDNYDLTSVKIVSCGSTYLRRENEALLAKRLNVTKILQIYAMTESLGGITADFAGKAPLGSCGYPLPNMSVQIIDTTTGKSLGPMMVGELCCRSDVVMKGYFNDPEATKNTIDENGWLHTGDMAYYDRDNMFYIVDRLKELIKCKGYQVAPAELETVLINHPKIADAGVIGIPHDRHGETPLAFVVTIQGKMLKEKEVKDFVNEQVAPYKRVESVLFVPQIPRNAAGKILRRALRNKAFERKSHL
ncbi:hypothetical protein PPYR_02592 [Photinus pyralis]|uniref:Luciferin 4-monooxygenase n=1 Tax=Photinus pyralis TaxID=7054 RepID=A0A5N4B7P1_PHOPY|nr:hypothetical protein PPYR_02592 [Photinus pyralis]